MYVCSGQVRRHGLSAAEIIRPALPAPERPQLRFGVKWPPRRDQRGWEEEAGGEGEGLRLRPRLRAGCCSCFSSAAGRVVLKLSSPSSICLVV